MSLDEFINYKKNKISNNELKINKYQNLIDKLENAMNNKDNKLLKKFNNKLYNKYIRGGDQLLDDIFNDKSVEIFKKFILLSNYLKNENPNFIIADNLKDDGYLNEIKNILNYSIDYNKFNNILEFYIHKINYKNDRFTDKKLITNEILKYLYDSAYFQNDLTYENYIILKYFQNINDDVIVHNLNDITDKNLILLFEQDIAKITDTKNINYYFNETNKNDKDDVFIKLFPTLNEVLKQCINCTDINDLKKKLFKEDSINYFKTQIDYLNQITNMDFFN